MLAALLLSSLAAMPLPLQDAASPAPDLAGKEWLNTDRPLASWERDLRGHVVLLDFWTYCCINCMHVLADLAKLEEEFRDEPFLVIGVHSAKFEQESDAANIRQAVLRHRIRHPVVVDEGMRIWNSFGVRAWPTLFLVDPEGSVIGYVTGEGNLELLREVVRSTLDKHREKGTLADAPLRPVLEPMPERSLLYPGKVHAHRGKLYVSDSGANRVLEVDVARGEVLRVFGGGEPGLENGPAAAARFRNPQGLAGLGDRLYVADTGNHALRVVDLESGEVGLAAGTGEQARPLPRAGSGLLTALNSPWALEADGAKLHMAMAGSHQIWTFDTENGKLVLLAGSGRENLVDGEARAAELAQPSGLALAGRRLYFADSEVSALRYVDLESGVVRTVIGTGLFDFGDAGGAAKDALLQHPLGVAAPEESLLLADTYNNKIKRVDPESGVCTTFLGTGDEALNEETLTFWEPGGLDVAAGKLYVADTNHHRVVEVDLISGAWRVLLGG